MKGGVGMVNELVDLYDPEVVCKRCEKDVLKSETEWSHDYHGIIFRRVCSACSDEIDEIGYDGEKYDSSDEQIEDDY